MPASTSLILILHTTCLAVTVVGAILIGIGVDADSSTGFVYFRNSVYFTIACGCAINFLLLVNSGKNFPSSLPLALGISYFWFPEAISLGDQWRLDYENYDGSQGISKSNLRLLLAGVVIALTGTGVGVILEVFMPSVPKNYNGLSPLHCLGFLSFVVALGGCILVWVENKRQDSPDYNGFQQVSIQAALSAIFGFDALLFPERDLVITSSFMCIYTFCQSLFLGLPFQSQSESDDQHAEAGLCILAGGLAALLVMLALITPTTRI